jgi:aryl-alcohol dehydrogenase-like predicted oxidoreductase
MVAGMQTRRLGRTGHWSSVAILGGAAFGQSNPDDTEQAFRLALDAGVNHLDIAPQYGKAERLVGPLVPAVRDHLFVACKTLRKNADGARAQLEESLELLGCDSFDLYQLHAVTSLEVLDERAPAVDAILRARDEGLVRFVGITGHDVGTPAAQAEALRRYDLDTVMFPVNRRMWADSQYRSDAEALLELAGERDCGVMAIKAAAARPWGDRERTHTTWYEPYTSHGDIQRGVNFTLSVEGVHAFCTPGDVSVLPKALEAADAFTPMTPEERAAASAEVAHEPVIFPIAANA